ncbi:MAG: hypothetical protein LBR78_01990 [Holosporales bacterium]|jgi:hypothetical protein|nr:hypothetical protein [Holosporales bacterium]
MSISIIQAALALAQFTPKIAKWLSGTKAESISKKIVDIAKTVTNTTDEFQAIEKLKEDRNMYSLFQQALINSEREIELAVISDKESARHRDIAIINSGKRNKRADIMVVSAVVGLISCLAIICIFRHELPGEVIGIISTIAGIFGSCLRDAYNFEFGSSRGSKEKDQTVASILHKYNR